MQLLKVGNVASVTEVQNCSFYFLLINLNTSDGYHVAQNRNRVCDFDYDHSWVLDLHPRTNHF